MILPIPGGRITATFSEPRPLSNPGLHPHAALDVAPRTPGSPAMAVAPVAGFARLYQFLRPSTQFEWPISEKLEIKMSPVRSYFYDLYGGVLTIAEPSGRFHVLTHFFASAMWSWKKPVYVESKDPVRFPGIMLASDTFGVLEGEVLLPVGNAGFSTAPHIHWEIHPSVLTAPAPYASRLDPEMLLEGI